MVSIVDKLERFPVKEEKLVQVQLFTPSKTIWWNGYHVTLSRYCYEFDSRYSRHIMDCSVMVARFPVKEQEKVQFLPIQPN